MYRWLLAGLVLALGLLTWRSIPARDDAPADKAEKKEAKPEEVAKAHEALLKALYEAFDDAETERQKEKVRATYSKKLVEHARAYPGDKTALESLLQAVRMTKPGDGGARKDATELLLKDHVKTPHLSRALLKEQASGFFDHDIIKFLQGVARDNPDKTIRARTYQALVRARDRALELIARANKDAELRQGMEEQLGKPFVKDFLASEAAFQKDRASYLAVLRGELKGTIPDLMPGAAAPASAAVDLRGKKVRLSDYKGKVVVLDFWGTFCPPCVKMIPDTRKLVKAMEGKPFAFVSVSADEEKDALVEFLKKTPMPWDHWWVGADSELQKTWEVEGFPTVFVIDHKGVIRFAQVGYDEEHKYHKEVEKLVKEAEADKKAAKK